MVISGMAMVSAYEAHVINVKAHVENALSVGVKHLGFGTVFPEEFFIKNFAVATSGSFCSSTQKRVRNIDYEIWVEWKPKRDASGNIIGYYPWLGDAVWVARAIDVYDRNGDSLVNLADDTDPRTVWTNLGDPPTPTPGPGAAKVLGPITLTKPAPGVGNQHNWKLAVDVPVFREYYNATTDVNPKPSGLSAPSVIIEPTDTDRYFPDGVLLGVELKIQVVDIYGPPFP
jgi:hypothetical protein